MTREAPATPKRCLLIAPLTFYTFHQTIAKGLEARGYSVEMLNEEFPANSVGKLLGKLCLPMLRWLTLRSLKVRLDGKFYDLILIIKGRGLGREALAYLRTKANRIVGYNFDSFRFNPSPLDWHELTDRYATFDIRDAAQYCIPLVHLFSAAQAPLGETRHYDISIVQRVHSDRLAYTDLLLRSMPAETRFFIYLYENSLLTFALRLLRHPRLYSRLWPYISFKPLSYAKAMEAFSWSRVTFDYAHPLQSGITVRCFEAQSLGVAVMTNNREAVNSGFFKSGSIAHLPKNADPATVTALVYELSQKTHEPRCRSLDDFLNDLLGDIK